MAVWHLTKSPRTRLFFWAFYFILTFLFVCLFEVAATDNSQKIQLKNKNKNNFKNVPLRDLQG